MHGYTSQNAWVHFTEFSADGRSLENSSLPAPSGKEALKSLLCRQRRGTKSILDRNWVMPQATRHSVKLTFADAHTHEFLGVVASAVTDPTTSAVELGHDHHVVSSSTTTIDFLLIPSEPLLSYSNFRPPSQYAHGSFFGCTVALHVGHQFKISSCPLHLEHTSSLRP
jgi:hypothetical protein